MTRRRNDVRRTSQGDHSVKPEQDNDLKSIRRATIIVASIWLTFLAAAMTAMIFIAGRLAGAW